MQLAAVGTILFYAYFIYGLFFGDVGHWATLSHDDRVRIATNIDSAVFYLNIVLGVFLVTVCILFYDEEPYGYALVAGSVALYYGLPFLLDFMAPNLVADWQKNGNRAALAIFNQLKMAALMMAIPGGILTVRDLFLRIIDGGSRRKEEFSAMQYGGSVREEEENVGTPILGIFAKCWQLPYCRPAIRKGCPIYHARTRCWRQRVGCMCEENVIRHAMDALIGKELIKTDQPDVNMESTGIAGLTLEKDRDETTQEKTTELPRRHSPPPHPRNVKIPHNPNIPMKFKVERCRNCVIYNEHQRMKYQFFAPLMVLLLPALTIWQFDVITNGLNRIIHTMDTFMSKLSLAGDGGRAVGVSLLGVPMSVQYIIIGCLVVIGTTMVLRAMEYVLFKWKI